MERVRNAIYNLDQLQPGDRFYFKGDRKKQVYTLNDQHPFEFKTQAGFQIKYANCRDETILSNQLQIIQFKANRSVVFLRNIHKP